MRTCFEAFSFLSLSGSSCLSIHFDSTINTAEPVLAISTDTQRTDWSVVVVGTAGLADVSEVRCGVGCLHQPQIKVAEQPNSSCGLSSEVIGARCVISHALSPRKISCCKILAPRWLIGMVPKCIPQHPSDSGRSGNKQTNKQTVANSSSQFNDQTYNHSELASS
jgi:hypothetical protein